MNSSPLPANTAGHRPRPPPAPPQPEWSLVEHPAPPWLHTPIPSQGLLRCSLLRAMGDPAPLRVCTPNSGAVPPAHPKCGAGDAPGAPGAGQHPPRSSHPLPHSQDTSPCSKIPSWSVPALSEPSFPSTSLCLGLELAPSTSYVLGRRWEKFLC